MSHKSLLLTKSASRLIYFTGRSIHIGTLIGLLVTGNEEEPAFKIGNERMGGYGLYPTTR